MFGKGSTRWLGFMLHICRNLPLIDGHRLTYEKNLYVIPSGCFIDYVEAMSRLILYSTFVLSAACCQL